MIGATDSPLSCMILARELEKIPFLLESGRYLPAVDHFVPPDVSWDDYRYFCDQLKTLIEWYPPSPNP